MCSFAMSRPFVSCWVSLKNKVPEEKEHNLLSVSMVDGIKMMGINSEKKSGSSLGKNFYLWGKWNFGAAQKLDS